MTFPFGIQLDSVLLPHLLAVLGLLMSWELHAIGVRAGRIKARPIHVRPRAMWGWVKSHTGVRMYIVTTPNDQDSCEVCRKAIGKVFSPAKVRKKDFRPHDDFCKNPAGCRCEIVGLSGNWPEAEEVLIALRQSDNELTLSEAELVQLIAKAHASQKGPDRAALYVLEALHMERNNPQFAMSRYRSLIAQGLEAVPHPYVVTAYLRLSDLLERGGSLPAALSVVDEFMQLGNGNLGASLSRKRPTRLQTKIMALRRVRLVKLLKAQAGAIQQANPKGVIA